MSDTSTTEGIPNTRNYGFCKSSLDIMAFSEVGDRSNFFQFQSVSISKSSGNTATAINHDLIRYPDQNIAKIFSINLGRSWLQLQLALT